MADVLVMFKKNNLVPMTVTQKHIDQMKQSVSGNVYYCADEDEALEMGYDTEVLFFWGGSGLMPERYCCHSRKLKWINTFSSGIDPILNSSIKDLPVKLTNARGIHGKTMALTAMGYIISFMRYFPEFSRRQRQHIWSKQLDNLPQDPESVTVGVIGAGMVGSKVGELAKKMGMRVLGVRHKAVRMDYFDEVFSNDNIDKVLIQSDFVVIVTPLTEETYHLFTREKFKLMKSGAFLINIARGSIVKEEDLIEALQTGEIAGAALDTVENEPLDKKSPLWDMNNVIITPHSSADSNLYMDRAVELFCKNLKRYENNETLVNEISLKKGY